MFENMIVPVLNRYDLLQRMLDSVTMPVRHLLIIDNGAGENPGDLPRETLNISEKFSEVTYLPMPANLGVAASWNLGIKCFPYARRWFFVSNDVEFGTGALETLYGARRDEITLTGVSPFWQAFALGDEAVSALGLFDEGFFPAYFEDNDYERRAEHAGVKIRKLDIDVKHDNSSTMRSDPHFIAKNSNTFSNNQTHYSNKVSDGDFSAGSWSVERRRLNGWERDR
jgi:GT2 family glycosyltransferase